MFTQTRLQAQFLGLVVLAELLALGFSTSYWWPLTGPVGFQ